MASALFPDAPSWIVPELTKEFKANAPSWYQTALATMGETENPAPVDTPEFQQREQLMSNRGSGDFEGELLSFVISKEAPNHGYDDWFGRGFKRGPVDPPKPPTQMTIDEVLDWQQSSNPSGPDTSAVGAFQFIHKTLLGLKEELGLDGSEMFNKDLQEKLARHLLKRRGVDKFLAGKISHKQFGNNLAKEWASLPVLEETRRGGTPILPGQSYYTGDGVNKTMVKGSELQAYEELFSLADVETITNEG